MYNMIDCLVFKNNEDYSRALKLLEKAGIEVGTRTCYMAALEEEVVQTLDSHGIEVNSENVNKVLEYLENDDSILDGFTENVNNAIINLFQ